jgi:hypothetical protein
MTKKKKNYTFSPTALSQFEDPTHCKEKWRAVRKDKEFSTPSNEWMELGNYFEGLVLGEDSIREGTVADIKAKLKKSVYVERAEVQAEKVKDYFEKDYEIVSVDLWVEDDEKRGYIDVVLKNKKTKKLAICDLKFTGDITNDYGNYQWADVERIDFLQLLSYKDLYKNSAVEEVFYLVADRSPRLGVKRINMEASDEAILEMHDRYNRAYDTLYEYEKNGYPRTPSTYNCKTCQLNDCPFKGNDAMIQEETVKL